MELIGDETDMKHAVGQKYMIQPAQLPAASSNCVDNYVKYEKCV